MTPPTRVKFASYKDAQGFRKEDNKLKVKHIPASIYHYGWVRNPTAQQQKNISLNKLWHNDQWIQKHVSKATEHDYSTLDYLIHFNETHPAIMQNRIKHKNWIFEYDQKKSKISLKNKLSNFIENLTGYRIGEYKNYIILP